MRSNVPFRLLIAKLRRDGQPVTALQLSGKTGIALYRMQNLYQGARATLDEWHAIAREIQEARRTPYNDLFPVPNSGDRLSMSTGVTDGVIADDTPPASTRNRRSQSAASNIAL